MEPTPQNMGQKTGINLHLTITVAPENAQVFLSHFKPVFDAVTAEPECTYFEVFRDPSEPGTFLVVENWNKDLTWFMNVRDPLFSSFQLLACHLEVVGFVPLAVTSRSMEY